MNRKPNVVSIGYRVKLNKEVIAQIMEADLKKGVTLKEVLEIDTRIKEIQYPYKKGSLLVTFWTSSIKKFDPKYNRKAWSMLMSKIENHLIKEKDA